MTTGPDSNVSALRVAWTDASHDLDISVTVDNCWLEDQAGEKHTLVAIVRDFGGRRGMAIFEKTDAALAQLATSQGFGYTWLGRSYERYDRLFEDTLNDWTWTGADEPPVWYTGEPWTE